jgi:hypothetical protein
LDEIKERPTNEPSEDERITKPDLEAIESLCLDTKAQLDQIAFPDPSSLPTKAQLDSLGDVLKSQQNKTQYDVELTLKALKDFSDVKSLVEELKFGLEELKEQSQQSRQSQEPLEPEEPPENNMAIERIADVNRDMEEEKISKADLDAIQAICMATKTQLDQIVLPDPESFPTKSQVEGIGDLLKDQQEKAQQDFDVTARALEDVAMLRALMEDVKIGLDELKEQRPSNEPSSNEIVAVGGVADADAMSDDLDATTPSPETITRADLDLIESLCLDLKAQLDEMALPDPNSLPTRSQVDSLGDLLKDQHEKSQHDFDLALSALEDLDAVKMLVEDLKIGVDELKERAIAESQAVAKITEDDDEKITKTDLDAIEAICLDTKDQLDQMVLPDPESLPTRSQVDAVQDSLRNQQESAQNNLKVILKGLEGNKLEGAAAIERIDDLRVFLENIQGEFNTGLREVNTGLSDHNESIGTLGKLLTGVDEIVGANATVGRDVKEVMEIIAREFERSHGIGEGLKADQDQKTAEILLKLDENFDEMMAKYDDAQGATEAARKAAEEKAARNDEALEGIRTVADDLKLSSDTLGSTVAEAVERLANDSKTVFDRVEDTYAKVDEAALDAKAGFQEAYEKIDKTFGVLTDVQQRTSEHQPRVLASLDDVLGAVREHKEQSEKHAIDAAARAPAVIEEIQAVGRSIPEKYDDAQVHAKLDKIVGYTAIDRESALHAKLDEIVDYTSVNREAAVHAKLDELLGHATADQTAELHEKLDKLISAVAEVDDDGAEQHAKLDKLISAAAAADDDSAELHAKLDKLMASASAAESGEADIVAKLDAIITHATSADAPAVHAKLDRLVEHASSAGGKSLAQMDLLDQIHQQVMRTASEVSAYFATQSRLLTAEREEREERAAQAALALERALAQRKLVEQEMAGLVAQRDKLQQEVQSLGASRDALIAQRTRLAADVAGLETARNLRHEELAMMEARAQALERRILDGIIDQSRALLLSRPSKDPEDMSLKRVSRRTSAGISVASATNGAAPTTTTSSTNNSIGGGGGGGPGYGPRTTPSATRTRPPPIRMNGSGSPTKPGAAAAAAAGGPAGRRILSLNQISNNVPTGAQAYAAAAAAAGAMRADSGFGNLKRSHSVKTGSGAGYVRRGSLGGSGGASAAAAAAGARSRFSNAGAAAADKENDMFKEEEGSDDGEPNDASSYYKNNNCLIVYGQEHLDDDSAYDGDTAAAHGINNVGGGGDRRVTGSSHLTISTAASDMDSVGRRTSAATQLSGSTDITGSSSVSDSAVRREEDDGSSTATGGGGGDDDNIGDGEEDSIDDDRSYAPSHSYVNHEEEIDDDDDDDADNHTSFIVNGDGGSSVMTGATANSSRLYINNHKDDGGSAVDSGVGEDLPTADITSQGVRPFDDAAAAALTAL